MMKHVIQDDFETHPTRNYSDADRRLLRMMSSCRWYDLTEFVSRLLIAPSQILSGLEDLLAGGRVERGIVSDRVVWRHRCRATSSTR